MNTTGLYLHLYYHTLLQLVFVFKQCKEGLRVLFDKRYRFFIISEFSQIVVIIFNFVYYCFKYIPCEMSHMFTYKSMCVHVCDFTCLRVESENV